MVGSARGTLYPERLPVFHRLPPAPDATDLVTWWWISEWTLAPGEKSRQHVLAFPASNLVVETGLVGWSGPSTRASYRDLDGVGWAVGALLRPASIPAFTSEPGAYRDRYVTLDEPELHAAVSDAMTMSDGDARRAAAVAVFSAWLVERVGAVQPEQRLANQMAAVIDADPTVRTLADVCERLAVSQRTLHRLARRYVGLTPAVMIRRRRLQDAAERVRTDPTVDLATIAADLGYADQAHLAREFRAVLGFTAGSYRRETASETEPR